MSSARVLRYLAVIGVLAALAPPTAGAAEPTEVSLADRETARSLMKTGDAKFRAGDFAGAFEDYRAADRLVGVPSTRLAMGKAQAEMGLLLQARETLLSARRMPIVPDESPVLARARAEAATLAQEIAERIPAMTVSPKGLAAGVTPTIVVDGQPLPAELAGVARKVDPGAHRIVATAPGYAPLELDVELAERETRVVELAFVSDGSPSDSGDPTGAGTGPTAPADGATAGAGTPGADSGLSPVAWVGFGVGAAGLLAGVIAGAVAASRAGDLEDACPDGQCPRQSTEADYDAAYVAAHASTVGFVVAGLGLGVGLVGLALPGPEADVATAAGRMRVRPVVGMGSLGLEGSF